MLKIAIISINQPSLDAAIKLQKYLSKNDVDIYTKDGLDAKQAGVKTYEKIDNVLASSWKHYDALICILSVGIVVRKIASLLESKATDPAVLVMSIDLQKIIPLLSGHLGGANELSQSIASTIPNCINFISTATDQMGVFAFDMFAKRQGMSIENISKLANISNRLINKQVVKVFTVKSIFESFEDTSNLELSDTIEENTVVIDPLINTKELCLKPKIFLGIGCNKGVSFEDIQRAFLFFLDKHDISKEQIASIASFEAKREEEGMLRFAKEYGLKIEFFDEATINSLEREFSKSASTKFFGLKGVAEPSAILISKYKELIIPKVVFENKITIAGAI